MEWRRPNECPRCAFVYTAFNRPQQGSFSERFFRNLRERRRYKSGAFGSARFAQAEQVRPWQCRCGTWLRAKEWTFSWVDVAGILVLGVLEGLVAMQFPWARNKYFFAIPIALWVFYRAATQVVVEEVPAKQAAG
jgi:hypothetical protein